MDIRYFLSILRRRFWIILLVMILAAIATYILVGQLPDKYKANATIATGIIEKMDVDITGANPFMQEFVTKTFFGNKIQLMTSPTNISLLTRRLVMHDLNEDESRFRVLTSSEESENMPSIDLESIGNFSQELSENYKMNLHPKEAERSHKEMFSKISKAFEYDHESLMENLEVKRIGDTDYIQIEFISENPELSYFTVNTFCEEIIKYFQDEQSSVESTSVKFYTDQVAEKKERFDSLTKVINDYKAKFNVIDIDEETKNIVGQLRDLEMRRERVTSEIPALERNIRKLDFEIKKTARETSGNYASEVSIRSKIRRLDREIDNLQDRISRSPNQENSDLERKRQKLVDEREGYIRNQPDPVNADEARRENQKLRDEKRKLEFDLEEARKSKSSLNKEIASKRGKQKNISSNEAELGEIEYQRQVAQNEYLAASERFDLARLATTKPTSEFEVIEYARVPEKPESKNRAILSAFSGVASGVLATLVIFLLTFFDNSSSSPYRFSQNYNLPLSGHINRIKKNNMNFNSIFNGSITSKSINEFKEYLRKIRYSVETSGAHTLLVTSNKAQEGKSFFLLALAYSLSLGNRKVLIIDTNFRNNSLSKYATLPESEIPFIRPAGMLNSSGTTNHLAALPVQAGYLPNNVDILGNFGGNMSPNEALQGKDFVRILYDYQQKYDYILMEGSALNDYADSKELSLYADKVLGVFGAQSSKVTADDESIGFLNSIGDKYLGSVLNRVDRLD